MVDRDLPGDAPDDGNGNDNEGVVGDRGSGGAGPSLEPPASWGAPSSWPMAGAGADARQVAGTTGSGEQPRHRALKRIALGVAMVLTIALSASAFVKMPYYRFSPGTLYPTESLVTVSGHESFPADGGQIDFTTVSSKKASVLDYYLAHFDEGVDLIDAEKFEGGYTPEENRRQNLEMMAGAKESAAVAALRKLGYPIQVKGTGALVKAVRAGVPAADVLKVNDTIVNIDGRPIELGQQLVEAIQAHKPGDTVTLEVEAEPGDPGRSVAVTLASRCAAKPAEQCPAGDAEKALLGIDLANRDTRFELPFEVKIDTKDVGGPSAGLAMALGIIDVLTPGSLTGGARVATTGEIDFEGHVGPIGGIKQKTHLVMRQGVRLFLVPAGEAAEAAAYAAGSETRVVGVRTLDEALKALKENGGSTDVVAQEAAARSGTTGLPN